MAGRKSKNKESTQKKEKKWSCACYIRLSQEDKDLSEEKLESNSISSQKALLESYLFKQKDLILKDWYIDDGYTGTNFNRPGFQRMLQDMKDGRINCVLVKDLSRLGRNYIEVGNYLEQVFPLFHIRFIALNDQVDNEKNPASTDNILIPFKNLLNDEYCRDTSLKIRSSLDGRKRKGEFVGAFAPYGYQKDPLDKHRLIIDPEAAEIVKKIFSWYVFDGVGKIGICHRLNEMGILNPTAYKRKIQKQAYTNGNCSFFWTPSTIRAILKNEVYLGHTIQGKRRVKSYKIHKIENVPEEKWIRVEHTHPSVISKEIFQKAQELSQKDLKVQNGKENVSIWAGILRCADCGKAMHRKTSRNGYGTVYTYYLCSTYQKKSHQLCQSHRIREKELEQVVLAVLQEQVRTLIQKQEFWQRFKQEKEKQETKQETKDEKFRKQKEILKLQKRKQELYEDWKNGDITKEEYHQYKQNYEKMEQEVRVQIEKRKEFQQKQEEKKKKEEEWIRKFQETEIISELSRELILELIEEIRVKENGEFIFFVKFSKFKKEEKHFEKNEK